METHEVPSPASSITKLGIVRFVISEEPTLPDAIVELPSFSDDDTSRPTVQMPPLTHEREPPRSIDEAFDPGSDDPEPDVSRRERSSTLLGVVPFRVAPIPACEEPAPIVEPARPPARPARPAGSWWHAAFAGAALI